MSHTCEFITGTEADSNGLPIMVYCEAPAVNFNKERWLCPEHYKQELKTKSGGYIYRQGVTATTVSVVTSKRFAIIKKP